MAHLSCSASPRRGRALLGEPRGGRHRERAGPARRPAPRRDRVEAAPGRGSLLGGADPAEIRSSASSTSASAPRASPRCTPRRRIATPTCATRAKVDGGCELPDHPALLRQRALLRLRRRGAGGGHRRCRSCRGSCRSRTSTRSTASPACAARRSLRIWTSAQRARRRPGSGCRARGRLRDPPVLRSPGARRARNPLLHPEPLTGNASHPGRTSGQRTPGRARRPRSGPAATARGPPRRRALPRRAAPGGSG